MSRTSSEGITPLSSLIRAHATDHNPPTSFQPWPRWWVFAGCCQSLLGDGPSRRYLCESFPGCLDMYRGGLVRCFCPFLPSRLRPSTQRPKSVGNHKSPLSDFRAEFLFTAFVIPYVPFDIAQDRQASGFDSHPGRSYRKEFPPWAAMTFTSGHTMVCYLPMFRIY